MTKTYYPAATSANADTWSGGSPTLGHFNAPLSAAGAATVSANIPLSVAREIEFTTLSAEPAVADWPNGTYTVQLNIASLGADIVVDTFFALTTAGSRKDISLAASAGWTTTGLHVTATAQDFAAGEAQDRFGMFVRGTNNSTMKAEALVLNVGASSCFMRGPWATAVAGVSGSFAAAGAGAFAPFGVLTLVSKGKRRMFRLMGVGR